jgi:signal transduction histidine kinase
MNREPKLTTASHQLPSQANIRLQGGWLVFARVAWAVPVVLALVIFFAGVPLFSAQFQTVCESPLCNISPQQAQTLGQLGISVNNFALAHLAFALLLALVRFAVGAVLVWHKSNDRMGLLVSGMLILQGTDGVTTVVARASSSVWQFPSLLLNDLAFVVLSLVLFLFPDGRFVPWWTRWIVVLLVVVGGLDVLFPDTLFYTLLGFGGLACFVPAQLYRYWRVSNQVQRQQTKWVIYSVSVVVVFNFLLFSLLVLPAFQPPDSVYFLFAQPVVMLTSLLFPISIGIAILRYQLWDIDVLINRTLVYSTLSAGIVGVYVLIVGGFGTLMQAQGSPVLSLVAAALVAVLFQPLRQRLQRGVNRLMYGERDTPNKVISRLGQRLETTLAPDAVLPTIVETVAQALKLPYAAITLQQDGEFVPAASYGQAPKGDLVRLPLVYQNEQIGELRLAPRAPGETFTSADRALLNDLARQAGIAASAVRLTIDLQRLAGELQHSRTQLVTTREEERRRLRRDLHDGLGPALGSLTLQLDTARNLFKSDPPAADALLVDLKTQVQTAIADIRRLVYELRPPTLDELGLVSALREQVTRYRQPGLSITLNAPEHLPPLPAAVEVAIYRIAQEALTNVVRHAHAQHCVLTLEVDNDACLEVRDNGQGLPADYRAGVGLTSMRERATELGGTCAIAPVNAGGTRVFIRLPLLKE